ncbi:MAG TPA: hypothetical protein DCY13_16760, partial [Verrucomicrobiales bacterium]|nr:hypothetical protein [Verrucomicrobiales bacterium]
PLKSRQAGGVWHYHRTLFPPLPMTRLFSKLCPFFAVLCLFVANGSVAADRPNILWITAEDMSPHLGAYGDTYATTPHL